MVQRWEPGTEYGLGNEVEYNGVQYKLIQPHRSQSDWTPDVTPALWGREYGQAPSQPQHQQDYGSHEQRPWDKHDTTQVELSHEEKQKNWYDLDPERRKQLEVGGGLLAGAALLGGGFFAWKKHKEHEEDKKAQAWGLQNWMTDAQRRTQQFHSQGSSGPTWVLTHGTQIPQGAFVGGQEADGTPLYIARTFFENGIHPGKLSPNFKKGAIIGWGGDEIETENYEILIANPQSVRWTDAAHPLNVQSLGARPVEGGREADGTPLFIVQAPYKDGVHPGKTSEKLRGADITYGGDEKIVNPYRVLVHAD